MIRILIFIALIYVLYVVITRPLNQLFGQKKSSFQRPKPEAKTPPKHDAEEMAACEDCGTFISRREGETRGGRFVCKPTCHP